MRPKNSCFDSKSKNRASVHFQYEYKTINTPLQMDIIHNGLLLMHISMCVIVSFNKSTLYMILTVFPIEAHLLSEFGQIHQRHKLYAMRMDAEDYYMRSVLCMCG